MLKKQELRAQKHVVPPDRHPIIIIIIINRNNLVTNRHQWNRCMCSRAVNHTNNNDDNSYNDFW